MKVTASLAKVFMPPSISRNSYWVGENTAALSLDENSIVPVYVGYNAPYWSSTITSNPDDSPSIIGLVTFSTRNSYAKGGSVTVISN